MQPDRYQKLKEIFNEASELPSSERRPFCEARCGDDAELLAEVLELLEIDQEDDEFLSDIEPAVPPSELPREIGRYHIIGLCGSGGMGTVYEAEQDNPRRRVALKVVQGGAMRPELLGRFRREAEILGKLQHPGIAQIFEAGEFETGGVRRPFFAMEFVEGLPLLSFARSRELSTVERVELFVRIVDAMHHAHLQGIVHRDLKPDNILVVDQTGSGVQQQSRIGQPKILDFGVARLTDGDLASTLQTGPGQLIGSVPYMSPEQASGEIGTLDARSDVYALGVVLFELLTGRMPYEVRNRAIHDAVSVIQTREPSLLGTIESTLRGDLETIVGKALEKDPARRYITAQELADDLRRHLAHEPIHARPPSTWYQFQKFTQRNRVLVGGISGTVIALILGTILALFYALRAESSSREALASRAAAEFEAYRANLTAASALAERDPTAARRALDAATPALRGFEWNYLDAKLSNDLLHIEGPTRGPFHVSEEDGLVLARDASGAFGLWDVRSGERVRSFPAPDGITRHAVSGDGRIVAAASASGEVNIRSTRDESTWALAFRPEGEVQSLGVSWTGAFVVTASKTELTVWSPGAEPRTVPIQTDRAVMFDFAGDRDLYYMTRLNYSPAIHRFDLESFEELADVPVGGSPLSMKVSRDGKRIVVAEYHRSIQVHDGETCAFERDLLGHQNGVAMARFSSTGELVSVDQAGNLLVWDLEAGEPKFSFSGKGAQDAWFIDEDHVVSGGPEGCELWALSDRCTRVLDGHGTYVYDLSWAPDSRHLATRGFRSEALHWDAAAGSAPAEIPYGQELGFRRDGEFATGITLDQGVWTEGGDPELPEPIVFGRPEGEDAVVVSGFAGEAVVSEVAVWRVEHREHRGGEPRLFRNGTEIELGSREDTRPITIGEHPHLTIGGIRVDGKLNGLLLEFAVYVGALDDADARSVEEALQQRMNGAESTRLPMVDSARLIQHFRADAASLAIGEDGGVDEWSGHVGQKAYALGNWHRVITLDEDRSPPALDFHEVATASRWMECSLEGVRDAEVITVLWVGSNTRWGGYTHAQPFYSIGPRPFRQGRERRTSDRVTSYFSYSPGRDRILVGGDSKPATAHVRDVETGEILATFARDTLGVAYHPDGDRLALATARGTVEIHDARTFELVSEFQAHPSQIFSLAYSRDGKRLVTGGNDNVIRIWEPESRSLLLELLGHRQYVKAVDFSPDGSQLASVSGDRSVRVFDSRPPRQRFRENLEFARLREEVRPQVETWLADLDRPAAVVEEIERRYASEPQRMRAAKVELLRRSK